MADYTGGTKTMSVALVMTSLDLGVDVYLTTGTTRENLIRVERGERIRKVAIASVTAQRKIEQFLPLYLQQYNYPAAIVELENLLQTMELSPEDKKRVEELLDCCSGFDAWDRFEHAAAWSFLEPYLGRTEIQPAALFLKRVMSSREAFCPAVNDDFNAPAKIKGHGYEIVQDLVLNAERRAKLKRYDDAVARLYRALELLAQVRLWEKYQIKTGDVDIQKLPESLHDKYESMRSLESKKIEIALTKSYKLLSELPDEPLGLLYKGKENAITDALKNRNYSILAHGLHPVTATNYHTFAGVVVPFIQAGIASVIPPKSAFQPVQFSQTISI
jgi:CRISPR-associated protein (TIGR02710 family)